MIIIDSREQKPLWNPEYFKVKIQKLDEGDYTTVDLLGHAHIERKSGADLYGSIIQGHNRFRSELQRAQKKGIRIAVFVECSKEDFFRKRFTGGFKLKTPGKTLRKIITTITKKYNVEFVWCSERQEMREQALLWFVNQRKLYKK